MWRNVYARYVLFIMLLTRRSKFNVASRRSLQQHGSCNSMHFITYIEVKFKRVVFSMGLCDHIGTSECG